jgi:ribosomal protein S18 acetylase RimI-like enzyme
MHPFGIRVAKPCDATPISRVHVTTWREAYRGVVSQDYLDGLRDEDYDRKWHQILENVPARRRHFVAEAEQQVIGFVSAGPANDPTSESGEVHVIYVLPHAWGTGIGGALLTEALSFLAGRHREAILWVLADNVRARRFYERRGFALDGAERVEHENGTRFHEIRYQIELPARNDY